MSKPLKIILAIILIIVLIVGGYAIYLFSSYHRIEDNLKIDVISLSGEGGNAGEGAGEGGNAGDTSTQESNCPTLSTAENAQYDITAWNIGFAAYTDQYSFFMDGGKYSRAFSKEAVLENMENISKELSGFDSDFYLIQEVDVDATRSYHVDQKAILMEKLAGAAAGADTGAKDEAAGADTGAKDEAAGADTGAAGSKTGAKDVTFAVNYDSPYLFYPFTEPHGKSYAGLMTFSDYEITDALRRSLPIQTDLAKLIDLDRCYVINRIPTDKGNELVLINFHLSAYTTDPTIANQQLEMLYEEITAEYAKGNYVICGGDFNKDLLGDSSAYFGVPGDDYSWAQSFPFDSLPDNFSLVAPLDEENPVPSCRNADAPWDPETNFQLTIDGFIVSDNVEVVSEQVVDTQFKYSDHNPVQMSFRLK